MHIMNIRFENIIYSNKGSSYQDFFNRIMLYRDNDFRRVKPHGKIGDRGNDGWIKKTGSYYQVYAPEDLPKNNTTALKKIKDDFYKLKSYWDSIEPIKNYYFVVNDKFDGVSPHLTKLIHEIKDENELNEADIITSDNLKIWFFELTNYQQNNILGDSYLVDNMHLFYKNLTEQLYYYLNLNLWNRISDELGSYRVAGFVFEGFLSFIDFIDSLDLPKSNEELEKYLLDVRDKVRDIVNHYKFSEYGSYCPHRDCWERSGVWKKDHFHTQEKYNLLYAEWEKWMNNLEIMHKNLIFSLNLSSEVIRRDIDSMFNNREWFLLIDCERKIHIKAYENFIK